MERGMREKTERKRDEWKEGWLEARPLCLAALPLPRLPADDRQRLAAAGGASRDRLRQHRQHRQPAVQD